MVSKEHLKYNCFHKNEEGKKTPLVYFMINGGGGAYAKLDTHAKCQAIDALMYNTVEQILSHILFEDTSHGAE